MKGARTLTKAVWLSPDWSKRRMTRPEAEAFCRELASTHYENFTVVSRLMPRRLRQHFANIYAFCRIADDLADELESTQLALRNLEEWRSLLRDCYHGPVSHPVFLALQDTVQTFEIPMQPFEDLLSAFRQDQQKTRYSTWEELVQYCVRSANPVGHLVLYLCGYRDERRRTLSDATCTALQLTNFWQDVSLDHERGRIYIPAEVMQHYRYDEATLARGVEDESWRAMMRDLANRTWPLYQRGLELVPLVQGRLRLVIELFSRGGMTLLQRIEDLGFGTLHRRPQLSRWDKWGLLGMTVARSIFQYRA